MLTTTKWKGILIYKATKKSKITHFANFINFKGKRGYFGTLINKKKYRFSKKVKRNFIVQDHNKLIKIIIHSSNI